MSQPTDSAAALSLDQILQRIQPQDDASRAAARARLEQLTMPHWALGRLMDLAEDLAGITASTTPPTARKTIVTMAADHGVAAQGVSAFPTEVTPQMVRNFARGTAGVNALANTVGARVVVVDMGVRADLSDLVQKGKLLDRKVAPGTADMTQGPAMSRQQAVQAIEAGIAVACGLAEEVDVFGVGEMGIGNTTPASAIIAALTGQPVAEVTGRGTGIEQDAFDRKVATIDKALTVNRPEPTDALDVLAKVGGFEIAGIAGVVLASAAMRKPIVIDGFPCTAGAVIAQGLCPTVAEYVIASHHSVERGHRAMLERLGKRALLDLSLRLGEGTGAAMAMQLLEGARAVLTDVATFDEAAVSEGL